MERYNYYDAVKEDILNAIEEDDELLPREDEDAADYEERLIEALWASEVTGNGSYFAYYYSDEEDAIAAVMTNLDLCIEAYQEFGVDEDAVTFMSNIRFADVTIRCYILPLVIHDIIEEKPWFNGDEEED